MDNQVIKAVFAEHAEKGGLREVLERYGLKVLEKFMPDLIPKKFLAGLN